MINSTIEMRVKSRSETRKLRKRLTFDRTSLTILGSKPTVVVKEKIYQGDIVFMFEGKIITQPTRTSIQVDVSKHIDGQHQIDSDDKSLSWKFINHSCEPNGYIDIDNQTYVALRDIKVGEELTFDFHTTEFDISDPFDCECKSKNCLKRIEGFKHLDKEQKKKVQSKIAPHLKLFVLYDCSFVM